MINWQFKTPISVVPSGYNRPIYKANFDRQAARSELSFAPSDFVLFYCGRLSKEKNIRFLLDALALAKEEKRLKLLILGSGPDADELKLYARKLGIETLVTFIPEVPHDKISSFFMISDLFVCASRLKPKD